MRNMSEESSNRKMIDLIRVSRENRTSFPLTHSPSRAKPTPCNPPTSSGKVIWCADLKAHGGKMRATTPERLPLICVHMLLCEVSKTRCIRSKARVKNGESELLVGINIGEVGVYIGLGGGCRWGY
jgi:hypothetical protein